MPNKRIPGLSIVNHQNKAMQSRVCVQITVEGPFSEGKHGENMEKRILQQLISHPFVFYFKRKNIVQYTICELSAKSVLQFIRYSRFMGVPSY